MIKVANRRSSCPISTSLEIIGDTWTLILIRNFFLGSITFADFKKAPENIATNILSDRLKKLMKYNLIEYRLHPKNKKIKQYFLTEAGINLYPLIYDLLIWGKNNLDMSIGLVASEFYKSNKNKKRKDTIRDTINSYKEIKNSLLVN
tara:strand:- start:150 stop:590 length:441 start_codon:yes stop_codon:yes gene_type:complete